MSGQCRISRSRPAKELSRRGFLAAIEGVSILAGCVDFEPRPEPQSFRSGSQWPVSVKKAKSSQTEVGDDPSLCSLSTDLAWLLQPGEQVRIVRNDGEYALFTVHSLVNDQQTTVRIAQAGLQRLGTSQSFSGDLDLQVPALGLDDDEAKDASEFVERRAGNMGQSQLLVVAPHGGAIERYTDDQAVALAELRGAVSWVCKGWRSGGGAWDRWHITSTDINPASFPELAELAGIGFARVVSFHGMSDPGVRVGGGAPLSVRNAVADAIAVALAGSGEPVATAQPGDSLSGSSPANLVNWLSASGSDGIQLEQSKIVREVYGMAVVEAVSLALDGL